MKLKRLIPALAVAAAMFVGYLIPNDMAASAQSSFPTVTIGNQPVTTTLAIPISANAEVKSSAVVTATTTQLVAGVTAQSIYLFYAAGQSSGTNSASTINFEYGTGATCGTGTTLLLPTAIALGTAAAQITSFYGGAVMSGAAGGIAPAAIPFIIPAGNSLCMVTAGTTIAVQGIVLYTQQ